MNVSRSRATAIAVLTLCALASAMPAGATDFPQRIARLSVGPDGGVANGPSSRASFSPDGRTLVFETRASNIAPGDANGALQDIVAFDLTTGLKGLASVPVDGAVPDGDSSDPAAGGGTVVFATTADNLVPGDTNGVSDVVAHRPDGRLQLVSTAADGTIGNGPSSQPDIAADGRTVAFTSSADNLVPGDHNNQPDVFVKNLDTGAIRRVSVSSDGTEGNARSSSPAISADAAVVVFESGASNLVAHDANGVSDVFARVLSTNRTQLVSVSSEGRQANRSVKPGFLTIPDVSGDGRYVVWDSDADSLTPFDRNRRTDIFLRDRRTGTTRLVSASSYNVQGNNDSFAPSISPNGRYLSFQSFATNLAKGGGPGTDVYVRDLQSGTTAVATVTSSGAARNPEIVPQVLQRPSISPHGGYVAFSSTVPNLTANDTNRLEDVFVRALAPPAGRVVSAPKHFPGTVRLAADDPLARTWICQYDTQPTFRCSTTVHVPRGVARLRAYAGGPGMLFSARPVTVHAPPRGRDRIAPTVTVSPLPRTGIATVQGTASDASGIARVEIAMRHRSRAGCKVLGRDNRFHRARGCVARFTQRAHGRTAWSYRLHQPISGPVTVYVRAIDRHGNRGRPVALSAP